MKKTIITSLITGLIGISLGGCAQQNLERPTFINAEKNVEAISFLEEPSNNLYSYNGKIIQDPDKEITQIGVINNIPYYIFIDEKEKKVYLKNQDNKKILTLSDNIRNIFSLSQSDNDEFFILERQGNTFISVKKFDGNTLSNLTHMVGKSQDIAYRNKELDFKRLGKIFFYIDASQTGFPNKVFYRNIELDKNEQLETLGRMAYPLTVNGNNVIYLKYFGFSDTRIAAFDTLNKKHVNLAIANDKVQFITNGYDKYLRIFTEDVRFSDGKAINKKSIFVDLKTLKQVYISKENLEKMKTLKLVYASERIGGTVYSDIYTYDMRDIESHFRRKAGGYNGNSGFFKTYEFVK